MSAEKSAEKKRQQTAWWVPALILFILSLIGIRHISSQGWWENGWGRNFNSTKQTYQTINTGFSVQVPNQSDVSVGIQNQNVGKPGQPPNSIDSNQSNQNIKDPKGGQPALW